MLSHPTHGHRFDQVERLRTPERVARLEVERVIDLALSGLAARSVLDVGIGSALFSEAFFGVGSAWLESTPTPGCCKPPAASCRNRAWFRPSPKGSRSRPAFRSGLHGAGAARDR